MKNKIAFILFGIITLAAIAMAFNERSRSTYIRKELTKLRRELKEAERKVQASRIEASKLRFIVENERKKLEEATAFAQVEKLEK